MGDKKLGLFDSALADEISEARSGPPMVMDTRVFSHVDEDTEQQIRSALARPWGEIGTSTIHRTLRRLGFEVSEAAVRNYRIKHYPDNR